MTNEELRQRKESAGRFMVAGHYAKAAEAYRGLLDEQPSDTKVWLRFAEALELSGKHAEAISEYERLAEHFMSEGFAAQAVAVVRIVLRLDPHRQDMKRYLREWSVGPLGGQANDHPPAEKEQQPSGKLVLNDLLPMWSLDKAELRDVIRHMEFMSFQAGESLCSLCKEQGHTESLFGIVSGQAHAVTLDGHGHPVYFEWLKPGSFFCEHLFMKQSECHVRVIADTPAKVAFIARDRIDSLLNRFPKVREWVEEHHRQRSLSRIISLQSVFRHFPHEARDKLIDRFTHQRYPQGQVIVRQGGEEEGAFYVLRGGVAKISITPHGSKRPVQLSELREGDCFGGVGFLSNRPHRTTVMAQTDVDVCMLRFRDLHEIAQTYPMVSEIIRNFIKLELLMESSIEEDWADTAGVAVGE